MGSRYISDVVCPYCGRLNEEVYYAPTCGFNWQKCENCGETFNLSFEIVGIKREQKEANHEQ